MIKRLQIKIITVILGTLIAVFGAVLLVLNISVHQTSDRRTDDFMEIVIENDGFMFPPRSGFAPRNEGRRPNSSYGSPEMMRAGRFFYAKVDGDGNVFELNLDMMFDFSGDDAADYIIDALHSRRSKGTVDNFSYMVADKDYGQIVVFAERSIEILLIEQLTRTSLWVAGGILPVLVCLAAFFSKWMVNPIKTAFDRQRRFISDASHELKTPLTIINANIDVLQNEMGEENKRLANIKSQSERMNSLVHDLLMLAKTDEGHTGIVSSEFNLSNAILNTALEFESNAFENDKQYSYDIDENIKYVGDEMRIKQLVGILIDNAIRYSDAKGKIEVSLKPQGKHIVSRRLAAGRHETLHIRVYNTGTGVPHEERYKIFERFYRSDRSRSRESGGYGIGLSIAQAIVEAHKGKITVSGEHGKWICFEIAL